MKKTQPKAKNLNTEGADKNQPRNQWAMIYSDGEGINQRHTHLSRNSSARPLWKYRRRDLAGLNKHQSRIVNIGDLFVKRKCLKQDDRNTYLNAETEALTITLRV